MHLWHAAFNLRTCLFLLYPKLLTFAWCLGRVHVPSGESRWCMFSQFWLGDPLRIANGRNLPTYFHLGALQSILEFRATPKMDFEFLVGFPFSERPQRPFSQLVSIFPVPNAGPKKGLLPFIVPFQPIPFKPNVMFSL